MLVKAIPFIVLVVVIVLSMMFIAQAMLAAGISNQEIVISLLGATLGCYAVGGIVAINLSRSQRW